MVEKKKKQQKLKNLVEIVYKMKYTQQYSMQYVKVHKMHRGCPPTKKYTVVALM